MQRQLRKRGRPLIPSTQLKPSLANDTILYSEPTSCLKQDSISFPNPLSSEAKENINSNLNVTNDNQSTKDKNETTQNCHEKKFLEKRKRSKHQKKMKKTCNVKSKTKSNSRVTSQSTSDGLDIAKKQKPNDQNEPTQSVIEENKTHNVVRNHEMKLETNSGDVEKIERVMRALFEMISLQIEGIPTKADPPSVTSMTSSSLDSQLPTDVEMKLLMEENNTTNAAKKRRIGPSGYDSTITDEIRSASGSSQSSQFTEMNDSKVISSDVVGFMDSSVLSPLTDTIAASDFNNDKEFVTDRSSFSNFMHEYNQIPEFPNTLVDGSNNPLFGNGLLPLDSFEIGGSFLDFVPIGWDTQPLAINETYISEDRSLQNPVNYNVHSSSSIFFV